MTDPQGPLAVALEAAGRGWHVFPCGPDKRPLTAHGFKDASRDELTVRMMWTRFPDAAVGIATGASGLCVIDLDCKNGAPGLDNWHEIRRDLGPPAEDTMLVETPSGGMHVYYLANGHRVGCTTGKLAAGIDTRAEGGYVIAAGSPGYLYVDGHGPERLRALPALLAERLAFAPQAAAEPAADLIPEGQRDSVLASLAGTMRRRGMQPEEILAALTVANKTRCRPPLAQRQVEKIARSVGRYEPSAPVVIEAPEAAPPERPSPFIDWPAFWAEEDEQEEWVWDNVLAKGRGHAIYAVHKGGKSLLSLYMAAEMVTRRNVACLYLDYEMTAQDVRERLRDMDYGPESDLSHLYYALLPALPPLDSAAGGQALTELADGIAAGDERHLVVVIDTISRAVLGEENSADTWRLFYIHSGLRLKQRGCTWLRLDHGGKDSTRGQRGSSGKGDDVDVVWKLQPTENGVRLHRELSRMSWVPEYVNLLRSDFPLRYLTSATDWPEGTGALANLLDRLGLPLDASRREAGKRLREVGEGRRHDHVMAALRWRREIHESSLGDHSGTTGDHPLEVP